MKNFQLIITLVSISTAIFASDNTYYSAIFGKEFSTASDFKFKPSADGIKRDCNRRTALQVAAMTANTTAFEQLLAHDENPDAKSILYQTGDEHGNIVTQMTTVLEYLKRCQTTSASDTINPDTATKMLAILAARAKLKSCFSCLDSWDKMTPNDRLKYLQSTKPENK